jgi:hypothetical protein
MWRVLPQFSVVRFRILNRENTLSTALPLAAARALHAPQSYISPSVRRPARAHNLSDHPMPPELCHRCGPAHERRRMKHRLPEFDVLVRSTTVGALLKLLRTQTEALAAHPEHARLVRRARPCWRRSSAVTIFARRGGLSRPRSRR